MPKREITARRVFHNGAWRWRVIIPRDMNRGKQQRLYFKTKKRADTEAALRQSARENSSRAFFRLAPAAQASIAHALEMLEGRESEIVEAVAAYLRNSATEHRSVSAAIAECIEAKKGAGCRHRYLVGLGNALARFAVGREESKVHEVTARECESWINQSGLSGATRRSRQIDLGTFFSFCVKRGFCARNPIANLERHKSDEKEPKVLTPAQCAMALRQAMELHSGNLLAIVALQMFGGIRPDETYKLTSAHIRSGIIAITGDIAKKRDRRNVTINPTLKAWLDYAFANGAQLPAWDVRRRLTDVRKASVQPWPQDCLRHSFVSYHMEAHGWEQTVKEAGHSLAMAFEHYRALVTPEDARKFWELRPESITKEKQ
jgi:site-specific recombinase XerC